MNTKNLAILSFEGAHLLLPQECVAAIEMTSSIDPGTSVPSTIGILKTGEGEWPAYALSAAFEPYAECPANYQVCVAINRKDEVAFSIACEEIGKISIAADGELKTLQACMRMPDSPIESLLLRDGRLLLISDAEAMLRYLTLEAAA